MALKDWWTPKGWDRVLKKLNWLDISLLKASSFAFGLFVASYFTDFIVNYKWWILTITIILSITPTLKSLK